MRSQGNQEPRQVRAQTPAKPHVRRFGNRGGTLVRSATSRETLAPEAGHAHLSEADEAAQTATANKQTTGI